jgi:hypothetical protein
MLYIKPTGGLGNYLRVIFSWLAKARHQNERLTVVWERTAACNGYYDELFEPVKDMTVVRWTTKSLNYEGCMSCGDYSLVKELVFKIPLAIESEEAAIHIRGTDFGSPQLEPFEKFIESIDAPTFLATDDAMIQKHLLTKYSSKLKVRETIRDNGALRLTSLKHAIIDMYTCVKAKRFLGTKNSSFTDIIMLLRAD